jgi:hypothetical protein
MAKNTFRNSEFKIPDDWRGKMITRIRELIQEADPEMIEEVKYRTKTNPNGVLVWYHGGMISTGEVYNKHLRLGLAKGNILKEQKKDPNGLINSHRAVLIHEEDTLDDLAFKQLIRAAVDFNIENKKNTKK